MEFKSTFDLGLPILKPFGYIDIFKQPGCYSRWLSYFITSHLHDRCDYKTNFMVDPENLHNWFETVFERANHRLDHTIRNIKILENYRGTIKIESRDFFP